MRKMKLFLTAATVICVLSGCTGKTEAPKGQIQTVDGAKTEEAEEAGREAGKSESTRETEEVKKAETLENGDLFTCLISEVPTGVPFMDLTWTGFERIEGEYGAQVKSIEAPDKTRYSGQIRAMAEMGANPIYAMSSTVNEMAVELTPEYPETMFCLIDSNLDTKYDNVVGVYVDSLEPASVFSLVATKTTQSGTIGWIGSLGIPVTNRLRGTYLAGAKYAGPDVMVQAAYVGDDSDTVKAGEQTKIIVGQGTGIIFQTVNLAGLGVVQGCPDVGIKCIGVDEWQGGTDGCISWPFLIDINGAMFNSFTAYREDRSTAGRANYEIEIQSTIYDDRDYEKLPGDVKAELDELLIAVRSDPLNLEDLLKWQAMAT